MNSKIHKLHRGKHSQRGFTLLEAGIAFTIMSMILLGSMTLYISASRYTVRTQAETFATYDAGTAMQKLIDQAREAHWLALPEENLPGTSTSMFTGYPGYSGLSNYQSTDNGTTIDTAVMLTFPLSRTGSGVITVNNSAGNTVSLSSGGTGASYDRNYDGSAILVYRSDKNGVPSPTTGTYLWEYSLSDSGASVNQPLIRSVASVPNGVEFVRPTDSAGNVLPYQVQIKVVSGFYSPIDGVQTNEETNGLYTSSLTGMCVLMRDHEEDGAHEPLVPAPGDTVTGNHWISG
jgi:type II secretory pathway pseudopilin PulG